MADVSISLNRFGLGARPDEAPPAEPRRWLTNQLDRFQPALPAAPTSAAVASRLRDYYDEQQALREHYGPRKQFRQQQAPPKPTTSEQPTPPPMSALKPERAEPDVAASPDPFRAARRDTAQEMRAAYADAVAARTEAALVTPAPFVERLVHFWANHFAVSIDKLPLVGLGGTFEFEAIRPHVLGRFDDMLLAVERHPAMLLYLDQAVSIGPNSILGQRAAARPNGRKPGLNENLAREAMELHTLGVRTGYTQADVTEFARALTGWTVAGLGRGGGGAAQGKPGQFVFSPARHEPGARTVMMRRYDQDGEAQARAILIDLAASEATAAHICTKLARHFTGDEPPPALVARLKATWLRSHGDLPAVYRALIAAPEAWTPQPAKFRTPWEWSVASMRALGMRTVQGPQMVGLMNQLGQPVWKPGQPVGYGDVVASWAGPDAIMRRVEAAQRFAARAPVTDARALAPRLFPAALTPATAQALTRAESPAQALALLLVSPEMMRR